MNIKKFVKLNDNGEIEFDENGFQSEFDSEISRAVDKYKNGKGKDEMRRQVEEEAKQTAEEKLQKAMADFEAYKLSETIKLNQSKAQAKLVGKGFSEKEIEIMLSHVNDNEETSLSIIDTLIAEREKFIAETNKKAIESLQTKQQQPTNVQQFKSPDSSDRKAPQKRTTAESLSYYTGKQNN